MENRSEKHTCVCERMHCALECSYAYKCTHYVRRKNLGAGCSLQDNLRGLRGEPQEGAREPGSHQSDLGEATAHIVGEQELEEESPRQGWPLARQTITCPI